MRQAIETPQAIETRRNRRLVIGLAAMCSCLVASAARAQPPQPPTFDPDPVATLLELVIGADADSARQCLEILAEKTQSGEIAGPQLAALQRRLRDTLGGVMKQLDSPLHVDATLLAASWKDAYGVAAARHLFADASRSPELRRRALAALIAGGDSQVLPLVAAALSDEQEKSTSFRAAVLETLGRLESPDVARIVLDNFARLDDDLKPRAIELLTQRSEWSKRLMQAVGDDRIPAEALNVNQVRKLLASRDEELRRLVVAKWGSVRDERNPERERIIAAMRSLVRETPGDPVRGQVVFQKLCGQCHKIYGQGQDVGPDITSNGRASFEQLLSNVFDPSLVIGASYQARTLITADGRVLAGLLVEDNDQRIVLKMQGGKIETIPRDEIDELRVSKLSLMPEGLEKQLAPQDIADLFEFLTLNKPPDDPTAVYIPGTKE